MTRFPSCSLLALLDIIPCKREPLQVWRPLSSNSLRRQGGPHSLKCMDQSLKCNAGHPPPHRRMAQCLSGTAHTMISEVFPGKKSVLLLFSWTLQAVPKKGSCYKTPFSWSLMSQNPVCMSPEPSCMSLQVSSLLPVKCTPHASQASPGGFFPFHEIQFQTGVLSHTLLPCCSHVCSVLTGSFACRSSTMVITIWLPFLQISMVKLWSCTVALQYGEANQHSSASCVTRDVHI